MDVPPRQEAVDVVDIVDVEYKPRWGVLQCRMTPCRTCCEGAAGEFRRCHGNGDKLLRTGRGFRGLFATKRGCKYAYSTHKGSPNAMPLAERRENTGEVIQ